ncbi:hypothetical protein CDL15_Pgr008354 [Punica granatum]|uniref:Uncharacterized protein n=1 Tax=Punica granatum TaxID=22663 RepID=A0A218XFV8_PUNGR|nr:hypothetical protein CDL15_Pgr008354 [Punica granatum]
MHAELRAIREERDRLRCELVDSRAEVADYRELQIQLTRARARVAHLDREMARLSAELDRVHKRISVFVLIHSWNLGDHNWRHTATRLVSVLGWQKGIMLMFPKKSTLRPQPSLNHRRHTLRRLSLLQAYFRHIPAHFQHISRLRRLRGRPCHRPHQLPPPPMTKPALRPSKARSTKWPLTWQSCSPCSEDLTGPPRAPHLRQDRD